MSRLAFSFRPGELVTVPRWQGACFQLVRVYQEGPDWWADVARSAASVYRVPLEWLDIAVQGRDYE